MHANQIATEFGLVGAVDPAAVQPLQLIGRLAAKAAELIKLTPQDAETIVATILEVYDKYVAPFDIPGVGPLAEAVVDQLARQLLAQALHAIVDQLVK